MTFTEGGLDQEDAAHFQRVSFEIGVAAQRGGFPQILVPSDPGESGLAFVLFNNPSDLLPGTLTVEAIDTDGTAVFRCRDGRVFANRAEAVSLSVGRALAEIFPEMVGVMEQRL